MRVFLALSSFACAAAFASGSPNSGEDFLNKGMEYYVRGDYESARKLLSEVPDDGSARFGSVAYYLGSIAASEGDKSAYGYFEKAMNLAPKNLRNMAAVQFARFALANSDAPLARQKLGAIARSSKADPLLRWYYAKILAESNPNEAGEFLRDMLSEEFPRRDSIGADEFVCARLSGDGLASSVPSEILKCDTPAGASRAEMLAGGIPSVKFSDLSLLGKIARAEAFADGKGGALTREDMDSLKGEISENQIASFAWRGAFALARCAWKLKEWRECAMYAADALALAPEDFSLRIPLLMLKGDALRMEKNYDAARSSYLDIAMSGKRSALGEPSAEALYKTGLCWYEQGDWGKAHAYFERVFIAYFKYEYWGSRAYYYAARALWSLDNRRDANATLVEYFMRAKDKNSEIYRQARDFYDKI